MDDLSVEARVKAHFPTQYIPDASGKCAEKPLELTEALLPPAEYKKRMELKERQLAIVASSDATAATGNPTADGLTSEEQLVLETARYDLVKGSLDARSYSRDAMIVEVERAEQAANATEHISVERRRVMAEQREHDKKLLQDAYKHRDDSEQATRKFLDLSKKSQSALILDHEHTVAGRHAQLKALASKSRSAQVDRVNTEAVHQEQLLLSELQGKEQLEARRAETQKARQQLAVAEEVREIAQDRQQAANAANAVRIEARCTHHLGNLIGDLQVEYGAKCPREVMLAALKASLTAQLEAVETDLQSTLLVNSRPSTRETTVASVPGIGSLPPSAGQPATDL